MVRTSNRGSALGVLWKARRPIVRLAVLALFCLIAVTANSDESSRIIGGKPADPNKYQEFVSLTSNTGFPFCGGTLIRKSVVLTAAHCVVDEDTGELLDSSNWVIFKGDLNYNSALTASGKLEMRGQHSSRVKNIVPHPDYIHNNIAAGNDIALIFLENTLPGPFAKLPSGAVTGGASVGDRATIVGFGSNNNYIISSFNGTDIVDLGYIPPVLYEVGMTVAEPEGEDCDEVPLRKPDAQICYVGAAFSLNQEALSINGNQAYADQGGEFYKVDCFGDSGGPSFNSHGVQIGLVSYGTDEIECNATFNSKNTVHTKVRSYLAWIRRTILSQRLDGGLVSW